MKLYFDRTRSVFPTSVRLGEIIGDQFAPVIVYDTDGAIPVFFGARFAGSEYLIWEGTLEGVGEITLELDTTITMADFLRDMLQTRPSTAKSMSYQWILGYSTDVMEGFVTDTWDAVTRVAAGEIGWGTIAAVVGVGAVFLGLVLAEENGPYGRKRY